MIRAVADSSSGPLLLLGLDDENLDRLKAGSPISFNLDELELLHCDVLLFAGRDTAHLVDQLRAHGLPMPDVSEAVPGEKIVIRPGKDT